jgi:phenylalanyl-tRNA synthetase beta chain
MFSEYCKTPFSVEPVQVVYEDGRRTPENLPDLSNRKVQVNVKDIESMLFGKKEPIDLNIDRICHLCDKMQLTAQKSKDGKQIHVEVFFSFLLKVQ